MPQNVFLVHLFTAIFMTGLIWTIQLVHYPSFHFIEKSEFIGFEAFHSSRISFIVLPVMIAELLSAAALIGLLPELRTPMIVNFLLIGGLWLITLLVSARIHSELVSGYDEAKVNWLVTSNWARTALWSARAAGLCILTRSVMSL